MSEQARPDYSNFLRTKPQWIRLGQLISIVYGRPLNELDRWPEHPSLEAAWMYQSLKSTIEGASIKCQRCAQGLTYASEVMPIELWHCPTFQTDQFTEVRKAIEQWARANGVDLSAQRGLAAPGRKSRKSRRGRRQTYDWAEVHQAIAIWMSKDPDGLPTHQAGLEHWVIEWCQNNWPEDKQPVESTIREQVRGYYQDQ